MVDNTFLKKLYSYLLLKSSNIKRKHDKLFKIA
jgi:hypothetical protein